MRIFATVLLLTIATFMCFFSTSSKKTLVLANEDPLANDATDPHLQPGFDPIAHHTTVRDGMTADEVRLAGHLAHYVLAAVLRFPDKLYAEDKLSDLRAGKINFRQLSEDLNREWILRGDTKQSSGEIGLATFDEVPLALAKLLFDIRNPEASQHSMNLLGPVEDDKGVWVGAAFKRYRKQFFSGAWWDLAQFARQSKMKTSDLLQLIENQDRLWQMAFMIWPEEHVSFKRLKLRQIRNDFKKIGTDDPAVQMPAPKKKLDPRVHAHQIEERKKFFQKVDPQIIQDHPEIYAMSYDEIRQRGWHPEDAAVQRAKDKYNAESASKSQEIDPSKFAL